MNISQYIKSNKELSKMDFMTVYSTIIELLKDNRLEWKFETEYNLGNNQERTA